MTFQPNDVTLLRKIDYRQVGSKGNSKAVAVNIRYILSERVSTLTTPGVPSGNEQRSAIVAMAHHNRPLQPGKDTLSPLRNRPPPGMKPSQSLTLPPLIRAANTA